MFISRKQRRQPTFWARPRYLFKILILLQKAWWQNGSSALCVFVFPFVHWRNKPGYLCWGQLAQCRWRQREWAMNSLDRRGVLSSSPQPETADFNSGWCTGITTPRSGREELALELSCLGLINQLDLFSHCFRHLWYHPGLPLQAVRGMGT